MRTEFLSFAPPNLTEVEIDEVTAVLRDGRWLTSGPKTRAFEEAFRTYLNAPAALALNSCTAGLHLAMVVHGVKPGDEVITTPFTFCATANVVEHVGGTVRFADVDSETLLIQPREIERALSPKTKVILPVHFGGQPCDMPAIDEIARARGLSVVEDAAHCLPTKIGEVPVGAGDNLTLFSFYANKNITTGEGGMMTGRADLVDHARRLALHGMSRDAWNRFAKGGQWRYDVPEPGYKYNLTDIASALGLVQLKRLEEMYAHRRRIVALYDEAFRDSDFVKPVRIRAGVQSAYHLYPLLLNPAALSIDRDRFINELNERNIGTSVHYVPVHMMSYYANKYGLRPESFPNAHRAFERILSIPLSSKISREEAGDVIEAVRDVARKFAR